MRGCKGHNDSARLKIIREITRIMSWNESEPTTPSRGGGGGGVWAEGDPHKPKNSPLHLC